MNKFGKAIVKLRVPILIISILLLIPAAIGFLKTRVNYDVLSYLPKDIETMKGQDILADDFGTGAFSLCLVEGMDDKDVVKLKKQMEQVDNVDSVIWYDSIMDIAIPDEILPKDIREAYRNDDCTMMAIIFKTTMSSDETMEAITQIRKLASKQCFISGMSAVVTDTKDLCDKEVPIYVTIAVILSLIVLSLTMDSFLVPIFFLLSIGMAIVYNLGTNVFKGEISYITQALTAVLQLGVTMDYSIFLWHSYQEEKKVNGNEPDFNLKEYEQIDGLVTDKKNIALATTNADCILLLFFDPTKRVIANVHSGWRGTLQRISVETINKMKSQYGCNPEDIICCICPSIRKCHFKVHKDVQEPFYNEFKDLKEIDEIIVPVDGEERWSIDTVKINEVILVQAGLKKTNIIDCGICSVCNSDLIHSFRVEKEAYGLETALIELID